MNSTRPPLWKFMAVLVAIGALITTVGYDVAGQHRVTSQVDKCTTLADYASNYPPECRISPTFTVCRATMNSTYTCVTHYNLTMVHVYYNQTCTTDRWRIFWWNCN